MKTRIIASLAAVGVVMLTATGCGLVTTQATTIEYTASDGVNLPVEETAPLHVRNALVIADRDGAEGNLIAVLANTSEDTQTFSADWDGGSVSVDVPAGETVSLGANADPELLTDLDTLPGETVSMYVQPGDGEGVQLEVPVLNNCLTEYAALAPNDEHDAQLCEPVREVEAEH